MPSLKELLVRHEALQQELEQARQQEEERTLREIVAKMRGYKITLQELMGTSPTFARRSAGSMIFDRQTWPKRLIGHT